jgi:hypothetical protein
MDEPDIGLTAVTRLQLIVQKREHILAASRDVGLGEDACGLEADDQKLILI